MGIKPKSKIALISTIIVISIISVVAIYLYPVQTVLSQIPETEEDIQRNEALGVAQRFVVTTPTFAFDGEINTLDTLVISSLDSSSHRYLIKMSFDSSHEGYGNREGKILTNVITHHTIDIVVSDGNIISAVTDNMWDEINDSPFLKNSKLPSSSEPVPQFDGMVIDYQSLKLAFQSRGLEVVLTEEIEDSMFSVPVKVISVGKIPIQVYEFETESSTKSAKLIVSSDGTQIGLNSVRWVDSPHFYSQGSIIVQYIGHNPEILNLLDSFLGKQFAGV